MLTVHFKRNKPAMPALPISPPAARRRLWRRPGCRGGWCSRGLLEEGGFSDGVRVRLRCAGFGGVEDELDFVVFEGVHHVVATFADFVDFGAGHVLFHEVALGAAGGDDLEAEAYEIPDGGEYQESG